MGNAIVIHDKADRFTKRIVASDPFEFITLHMLQGLHGLGRIRRFQRQHGQPIVPGYDRDLAPDAAVDTGIGGH